jgi:beta-fructofuranosidase
MAFHQFRPSSHFIAPNSWSNDPCGAVYVPETQEYLFCYQWNPGTTEGGNCAWGMAKSKDLIQWEDCTPALRNGDSYDRLGVFSGSIVSRLIDERRVLFLFYTSVSALPIHWSKDYLEGCESQSVAFSTNFGISWHRYDSNPLMTTPPKGPSTTGWRDPFVSRWEGLSTLLESDPATNYMMIASGEKGKGSQLHLYESKNLLDWEYLSTVLSVEANSKVSDTSDIRFGMNFECASFFSIGQRHYIIVGVEEDSNSFRYNNHCIMWLSGNLVLEHGKPKFVIKSHGLLDHGISYAAHIFRDAEGRLLQLSWVDEAAQKKVISKQGWAGCLAHPRELYEVERPVNTSVKNKDIWRVDARSGIMTTLGVRPAHQVESLRPITRPLSLQNFPSIKSNNFEFEAIFIAPFEGDIFRFKVRECPNSSEVTKIIFDTQNNQVSVDRSQSSLESLGITTNEIGNFELLPGEDLKVRVFVDNSVLEVYINDRFALTSRIYPTLETSTGASYDFGGFDEQKVKFHCWEGLRNAWPKREVNESFVEVSAETLDERLGLKVAESTVKTAIYA